MNYQKFSTLLISIVIVVLLQSCLVGRFVYYNFADIKDYRIFEKRKLLPASQPFHFIHAQRILKFDSITLNNQKKIPFAQFLEKTNTVAFLIIRKDSIVYENYFSKYNAQSIVPSFSMAKSVTSLLIGCAIKDGFIASVNDAVYKYLPEFNTLQLKGITIEHLLNMTSGLKFKESYFNPFSDAAKLYYGKDLKKMLKHLKVAYPPGTHFEYQSGATQILGLVLQAALKPKSITEYFQEKIWTPIGAEYDASWSLDQKNGTEKTFCCINACAYDFAKIGQLMLNKGQWNGKEIVSQQWVNESIRQDIQKVGVDYYHYQWWISPTFKIDGDFYAQGFLGQYIYVNPKKNLVIVRLGKNPGKTSWIRMFKSIASQFN